MPTKNLQGNEDCTDITMPLPLYEEIPIDEDLEERIWKVASQLGDKAKVPTGREEWQLFSYQITEECGDLAKAFNEAKENEVDCILETRGVKIQAKRRAMILEVVTGWLLIPENQMAILFPFRTRKDALKEAKLHLEIGSGKEIRSGEATLSTHSIIVVFGGDRCRTEPPVPLFALRRDTTQLKASGPAEREGTD